MACSFWRILTAGCCLSPKQKIIIIKIWYRLKWTPWKSFISTPPNHAQMQACKCRIPQNLWCLRETRSILSRNGKFSGHSDERALTRFRGNSCFPRINFWVSQKRGTIEKPWKWMTVGAECICTLLPQSSLNSECRIRQREISVLGWAAGRGGTKQEGGLKSNYTKTRNNLERGAQKN